MEKNGSGQGKKSKENPDTLTNHLICNDWPEDTPPPVWPGNDVDWKGER